MECGRLSMHYLHSPKGNTHDHGGSRSLEWMDPQSTQWTGHVTLKKNNWQLSVFGSNSCTQNSIYDVQLKAVWLFREMVKFFKHESSARWVQALQALRADKGCISAVVLLLYYRLIEQSQLRTLKTYILYIHFACAITKYMCVCICQYFLIFSLCVTCPHKRYERLMRWLSWTVCLF